MTFVFSSDGKVTCGCWLFQVLVGWDRRTYQGFLIFGTMMYPRENEHDNGKSTIWRSTYFLLKIWIFHCHVSFLGVFTKELHATHMLGYPYRKGWQPRLHPSCIYPSPNPIGIELHCRTQIWLLVGKLRKNDVILRRWKVLLGANTRWSLPNSLAPENIRIASEWYSCP